MSRKPKRDCENFPWDDNGDEIEVDKLVAPDIIGEPFEIYYYEPFTGYGIMKFSQGRLSLKFPDSAHAVNIPARYFGDPNYDFNAFLEILKFFSKSISWIKANLLGIAWSTEILYRDIQNITLDGRTVEVFQRGKRPDIMLRVGDCDGERLYRELQRHYPKLLVDKQFEPSQSDDTSIPIEQIKNDEARREQYEGPNNKGDGIWIIGEIFISIIIGISGATILEIAPLFFDVYFPGFILLDSFIGCCFLWPIIGGLFGFIGSTIATRKTKSWVRIVGGALLGGVVTSIVFELIYFH